MVEIRRAEARRGTGRFRADIEGLRAIAVALVVLDHTWTFPRGGYVGVDVFFVISGYLITGQLVQQYDRTGTISFSSFYARRLRRIFPVATVVAIVTVFFGISLWFLPLAGQTALDGLSAVLWVSNWHFAAAGVDYLQASGPVSPFQHYWSLSVEEQFYLAWPWLMLGIIGLSCSRWARTDSSRSVILGIGAIGVVSFVWSILGTAVRPTIAYFDTFGRAWEFAIGALIAVGASNFPSVSWQRWRHFVPIIGILVILVSAACFDSNTTFPGPWAVVPVGGAALVIWGGSGDVVRTNRLLTARPVRFVGRISYSLYLWHFPVIVFGAVLLPGQSLIDRLVLVVAMGALSVASYHLIEIPARRSAWLSWLERIESGTKRSGKRLSWAIALGSVGSVALLGLSQVVGPPNARDWSELSRAIDGHAPIGATLVFSSDTQLTDTIARAVPGREAGDGTVPDIDAAGTDQQAPAMNTISGCRNSTQVSLPMLCETGPRDGGRQAFLIGDSVALSWVPTVTSAIAPRGWHLTSLGYADCSPYQIDTVPRTGSLSFTESCRRAKSVMTQKAVDSRSDVVFVSSSIAGPLMASGYADEGKLWQEAVGKTIDSLSAGGARVVLISAPPSGGDMRNCGNRLERLDRCGGWLDTQWTTRTAGEMAAVQSARDRGRRVDYVSARSWLCGSDGYCPPVIGPYIVRTDVVHLTNAFAESLGGVLAARLDAAGVLR